jgi:hypothetical protein
VYLVPLTQDEGQEAGLIGMKVNNRLLDREKEQAEFS